MIKPKKITISDIDGIEHNFIIYRFEAMIAFKIVSKSLPIISNMIRGENLKLEDKEIEDIVVEILSYSEKVTEKDTIKLNGLHLINNHVPDLDTLLTLIKELNDYNTNFLEIGKIFKEVQEFRTTINQLNTKMSIL